MCWHITHGPVQECELDPLKCRFGRIGPAVVSLRRHIKRTNTFRIRNPESSQVVRTFSSHKSLAGYRPYFHKLSPIMHLSPSMGLYAFLTPTFLNLAICSALALLALWIAEVLFYGMLIRTKFMRMKGRDTVSIDELILIKLRTWRS